MMRKFFIVPITSVGCATSLSIYHCNQSNNSNTVCNKIKPYLRILKLVNTVAIMTLDYSKQIYFTPQTVTKYDELKQKITNLQQKAEEIQIKRKQAKKEKETQVYMSLCDDMKETNQKMRQISDELSLIKDNGSWHEVTP